MMINAAWKFVALAMLGLMGAAAASASDWRFVRINDADARGLVELQLSPDGSFSGGTGCNRFTGQGEYSMGLLRISAPLASTRAACGDPALDAQERALFALLQGRVSFEYDPYLERLDLSGNDQTALLELGSARMDDELPAVFSARTVVVTGLTGLLNLRSEPSTYSDVLARLRPESQHASLGCERRENRDWCRLTVESGPTGWAAAEYLYPLTLGRRAKSGNYDKIGRLTCSDRNSQNPARCEYGSSLEGNHAIISVFVDQSEPTVLHFHGGSFDAVSSLGPFADDERRTQQIDDGIRVNVKSYTLDVPNVAITQ